MKVRYDEIVDAGMRVFGGKLGCISCGRGPGLRLLADAFVERAIVTQVDEKRGRGTGVLEGQAPFFA